jgi:hypothetical protein
MHVIKSKHNLMDNISCLTLSEVGQFRQSFEKLSAFYKFRYHVVIFIIFNKVNDSDNIGVRFLA